MNEPIPAKYPHGMFNVTKCIQYLKYVGVEVTPEQEREWMDAEITFRFLRSMGRTVREAGDVECRKGHITRIIKHRGAGKKKRNAANPDKCPHCGAAFWAFVAVWWEKRDGLIKHRDKSEAWRALDYQRPYAEQDFELGGQ